MLGGIVMQPKNKNRVPKGHLSRFYRYFLSYILLLVVVLFILGFTVYKNFILTMQYEVEKSNMSSITQIKNVMDMRLREMERTALNISFNNNLKAYKVLNKGFDSLEAVRELSKYKSGNEFIYDIALFYNYKGNKRIHTTLTSVDIDIFLEYIYNYENIEKTKLLNIIQVLEQPTMYPVEEVLLNRHQNKRFATYIYPLPVNAIKPYMMVMFFIDETVLMDMLSSALDEYDGYIYILDRDDRPIAYLINDSSHSDSTDILNQIIDRLSSKWIDSIELNGNHYSVAKVVSEYNGWSYILATRTDQLMEKVNSSRALFNYIIVLVLLLGVLIAFAFAVGNYRPLKELVGLITSQNKVLNHLNCSDEFDYVIEAIKEVSNENKSLTTQLKSRAGLMRNQLTTKLLKGKIYDLDEWMNMAENCGLSLDYTHYTVLIFWVDDYSAFEADSPKKTQNLVMFSIINVVEELSEEIGRGYGVELADDRGVALLLNIEEEYTKERYISELAFKTKEFFKQYFGFTLTVGIGNIYRDITMVHESFLEANRAVYYRLVKGYDNVIFYEDIKNRQEEKYKYPVELEDALIMSIKQGRSDDIGRITEDITEYITKNAMSLEAAQCICFGIINAIMKTLNEMNIDPSHCFKDEKGMLFAQPFETVADLSIKIVEFCSVICEYVKEQKESKNFELREQLLELVEQNYRDHSLSLEIIADQFQMSPSYISRYFKDQTGYSIMQYVDMLRMNEVKKLLKETDLPIKDILPRVGYIDQSSFYRKFKKAEGVTPIQYRNIVQE